MRSRSVFPGIWWIPIPYGIFMLIMSFMFFFHPAESSAALVWALGLFWLLGGILKIVSLLVDQSLGTWKFAGGLLGIIVGCWIVFPGSGAQSTIDAALNNGHVFNSIIAFVWLIGGLIVALTTICAGITVRSWPDIFVGIAEFLLAGFLIANLFAVATVMPLFYGGVCMVGGLAAIAAAVHARNAEKMIFG